MIVKALMLVLTAVYPLFMVVLSGAGLIYNRESYGGKLFAVGVLLVISGAVMAAGAVLSLFRKDAASVLAVILSVGGLALCYAELHILCGHADSAGWTDAFTLTPISSMYKGRIMPCIVPVVLAVFTAATQFFSYEAAERRRQRKEETEKPAPKIIE